MNVHNALLRADLWRLLGNAFACPTAERWQDLLAVSTALADCLEADATALAMPVRLLSNALADAEAEALAYEYHTLFTTQVLVSPYEGAYQRTERGAIIGDIAAFYRAFSLQVAPHSGPPDALCNELTFLAWLACKEAYALDRAMPDAVEVTRAATRRFLEDHLGRWVTVFVRKLLGTTGHPVYVTAAQLLVETVALAAEELGIVEFQYVPTWAGEIEAETVLCPVATP